MLRLLIAEDDPVILDNLQHHFNWETLGFTVCGAVTNGTDALHALALLRPDVLLTDMEMPGHSGLDVMEQIAREHSDIKVVFLSAYDDYDYVRPALRLGAVDYLLKPLSEEKLCELFLGLAETIRNEKRAREMNARETYYLEMSRQTAYTHILLQYLLGNHTDPKMLQLTMEHFRFPENSVLNLVSVQSPDLIKNKEIPEFLQRLYEGSVIRPVFLLYQKQVIFLLPGPCTCLDSLLRSLLPSGAVYRCVLSESAAFSDLPGLFQTIHANRTVWFYLPQNRIVPVNTETHRLPEKDLVFPKINDVCDLIKRNETAALGKLLALFFQECRTQNPNPDTLTIHMADLYSNVTDQLRMVQPKLSAADFEEFYRMLQKSPNLDAFQDYVSRQFSLLTKSYADLCAAKGDLIDRVQDYIEQNYTEDLSLGGLAEIFYVTPAYLSSLFSKRTGDTITAHLQNTRLDRAAALLISGNQPVAKIGATVGYPNYSHFCRLFRRRFHVTPTDYRNLHRP